MTRLAARGCIFPCQTCPRTRRDRAGLWPRNARGASTNELFPSRLKRTRRVFSIGRIGNARGNARTDSFHAGGKRKRREAPGVELHGLLGPWSSKFSSEFRVSQRGSAQFDSFVGPERKHGRKSRRLQVFVERSGRVGWKFIEIEKRSRKQGNVNFENREQRSGVNWVMRQVMGRW